jgi:hypothetical protein
LKKTAALIAALLAAPLSLAAAPPMPAFVADCLEAAGQDYEPPHGQFEAYMLQYFDTHDESVPWAIADDINGDGIEDWAGMLRHRDGRLDLIVVYSYDGDYRHKRLARIEMDSDSIGSGVVVEPPGPISGFPHEDGGPVPTVTLDYPGIHLLFFEKASILYYWHEDSFRELVTSD